VLIFSLGSLHIKIVQLDGKVSVVGRKISNLSYADDTTLLAQSDEELLL